MSYGDTIQRAPVIWHEGEPYIHRGYATGVAERADAEVSRLRAQQIMRKENALNQQTIELLNDKIKLLATKQIKYDNGIDYVPVLRRGDPGMADAALRGAGL